MYILIMVDFALFHSGGIEDLFDSKPVLEKTFFSWKIMIEVKLFANQTKQIW